MRKLLTIAFLFILAGCTPDDSAEPDLSPNLANTSWDLYSRGPVSGDETLITDQTKVNLNFVDATKMIQTEYCCGPRVTDFIYTVKQDTLITNNTIVEHYWKIEEHTADRLTIRGLKLINLEPNGSFQANTGIYKLRKAN